MRQVLIACTLLLFSCTPRKGEPTQSRPVVPSSNEVVEELTEAQELGLDAFNILQMNTDERNHVYSTFPGILHDCSPDTSIELSQAEFEEVMIRFVDQYCREMEEEKRHTLAKQASRVLDQYTVNICLEDGESLERGTWLFSRVLGKRDIIMVW
ncbi:hypothetical protein HZ996_11825 [Cryomorphaceae bacterium]|nr:hypothetical protein HZ996_11825 [Cryomorphaceae bacterium]